MKYAICEIKRKCGKLGKRKTDKTKERKKRFIVSTDNHS